VKTGVDDTNRKY